MNILVCQLNSMNHLSNKNCDSNTKNMYYTGSFTVSGSIRRYRVRGFVDNENIATSGYAGSSHQHFVILN